MMGRHKTVVAHQIVYRVLLLACLFTCLLVRTQHHIRLLRFRSRCSCCSQVWCAGSCAPPTACSRARARHCVTHNSQQSIFRDVCGVYKPNCVGEVEEIHTFDLYPSSTAECVSPTAGGVERKRKSYNRTTGTS